MIYNYENLIKFCEENNLVLLEDYKNVKINYYARIRTRCKEENCDGEFSITFSYFKKASFKCKVCSTKASKEKYKKTCLERYGCEN